MSNDDRLRVDRSSYQTHADDTHANVGEFRASGENVDRHQAHLQSMTEDGVGSEEFGQVRASTRHHVDDVADQSSKLASRTAEQADEFIGNVRNAASKNIRPV